LCNSKNDLEMMVQENGEEQAMTWEDGGVFAPIKVVPTSDAL